MRPSSPRSSRISSTVARYSRSSSRVRPVDGLLVGTLLDLDAQLAAGAGLRLADQGTVLAGERDRAAAAGQAYLLGDLGDHADVEKLVVVAWHEHHALVLADVDRQRDAHVGEHDGVVERDQPQQLPGLGGLYGGVLGGR